MKLRALVISLFMIFANSGELLAQPDGATPKDVHSYSNPDQVRVKHVDLDWNVQFDQKILEGTVVLQVARISADKTAPLILDTRDLQISKAEVTSDGKTFRPTTFTLGTADKILGAPLTIQLPPDAAAVRVSYKTSPGASGLQWLAPSQTAAKKHPFMFTQSQAIHARSWIPLQDTPQVRISYQAHVKTPPELLAVMSAENEPQAKRDGDYTFRMRQPIPAYLIALAVGDLDFRPLGRRTGVYAERPVVERAAREFADTERMIKATEALYGSYRWERYDLLVLPPSFPFGGMENPRLTFATPTILAGDKSLVSLVAHELAHSWSGNLVTNATWRDFWLNEGFTVYLERRIQEAVYGVRRARMEAAIGYQDLQRTLADLEDRDEILHVDLTGRDPDDGFTEVPYEKGALFLRHLEATFGRAKFDQFLRRYFDHFAFQSITTADFVAYLKQNLLNQDPTLAAQIPLDQWLYQPGLPAQAPKPTSDAFTVVEEQTRRWLAGQTPVTGLPTSQWTTQEWLHFLRFLPADLGATRMAELDRAFRLTSSGNSEILQQWLLMSIRQGYEPASTRLAEFLTNVGRRKYIKPLYEELAKTPAGLERARSIYRQARPMYHPIAVTTVDEILKWTDGGQ